MSAATGPGGARPAVFVTNRVHREVIAFLEEFAEVEANPSADPFPREVFFEKAARASGMMVFMNDSLDAAALERCPKLRIVAGALKGYDNFDVSACTKRGIWFTIVPDLLTIPTAELTIALMLGLARKVLAGDRVVRSGAFAGWRPILYGAGLSGSTVGIVGMGKLGRAVAERLAAFGMKILYADPVAMPAESEKSLGAARAELHELVARSDFVVVLAPLAPGTLHLFDAAMLARMKPGSFLVNVGRGSVVDEQAVANALRSEHLAGYAADVFEMEDWARADRPAAVCPDLLAQDDKTLFTPHLGSAVRETRLEIEMRAARNIAEALAGRRPPDAINEIR
ncbi:MAG: phosphonate dehydrogenase [Candidatus Acidiferrales bacterium]